MFDSLMPGARPRRLWLAIVVIGAITLVGLFVMFGVMWHDVPRHPPKKRWHAPAGISATMPPPTR